MLVKFIFFRSIGLVILMVVFLPRSVWAWRTVTTTLGVQSSIAVTIHNPSSLSQVIQLTIDAKGKASYSACGSCAGGYSMTCTSGQGNTCSISGLGNQYTIPSNGLFKAQVSGGNGCYGTNTGDGAVLQIRVQDSTGGSQGHIVATGESSYNSSTYVPFPINAGRPF